MLTLMAGSTAVPHDPLLNDVFLPMQYNCFLDARDFYRKQLAGKIVADRLRPSISTRLKNGVRSEAVRNQLRLLPLARLS
jgi:hypothetical protein